MDKISEVVKIEDVLESGSSHRIAIHFHLAPQCEIDRLEQTRWLITSKSKTVELVIEREPWVPDGKRKNPTKLVEIFVDYHEKELRDRVKAVGGLWDPAIKKWRLPLERVRVLGLEERMNQNQAYTQIARRMRSNVI